MSDNRFQVSVAASAAAVTCQESQERQRCVHARGSHKRRVAVYGHVLLAQI